MRTDTKLQRDCEARAGGDVSEDEEEEDDDDVEREDENAAAQE